jgi:hypothetical protein
LSSQTTDTFEYSRNNSFTEFLFRISSLRCFNLISFNFTLQIRLFSRNSLGGMNPPSKKRSIFFNPRFARPRIASYLLGVCRHSAVATQKTIHAPPRACKSPAEERAKCVALG